MTEQIQSDRKLIETLAKHPANILLSALLTNAELRDERQQIYKYFRLYVDKNLAGRVNLLTGIKEEKTSALTPAEYTRADVTIKERIEPLTRQKLFVLLTAVCLHDDIPDELADLIWDSVNDFSLSHRPFTVESFDQLLSSLPAQGGAK